MDLNNCYNEIEKIKSDVRKVECYSEMVSYLKVLKDTIEFKDPNSYIINEINTQLLKVIHDDIDSTIKDIEIQIKMLLIFNNEKENNNRTCGKS